ncbi:MAG: cysteine--tRNA ligase, partial [Calditrichaeota bacterium]|nr:cysteine--tRNA ligase [Calditrichota bacterium]
GHAHLGHAKSYVSFDVIYRYLQLRDYKVKYVQNITDVGHLTDDADEGEDKIAKKAREERIEPMAIVETFTKSYFDDMDALNVKRADIYPRASGHIIEQIEMIQTLIEKDHAYVIDGTVYFDVRSFKDYGKLSGRKLEDMKSGTRVESKSDKRNPEDFALWKVAGPEHIMKWTSPWGQGYPGWHIECSAMSRKYLGDSFDIHGGGMENQFPHHECEIAQSESANDKRFVKYWMHNNMVTRDGVKMGKSLGNSITLKEAIKKHGPMAVRFFVIGSHYRSNLDYSEHALESAAKGLKRIMTAISELQFRIKSNSAANGPRLPIDIETYKERFFTAMDNDFSTPEALAILFELVTEINSLPAKQFDKQQLETISEFMDITVNQLFGLIPEQQSGQDLKPMIDGTMSILMSVREQSRLKRDWGTSDFIRDRLAEIGIELKDTPDGQKWLFK